MRRGPPGRRSLRERGPYCKPIYTSGKSPVETLRKWGNGQQRIKAARAQGPTGQGRGCEANAIRPSGVCGAVAKLGTPDNERPDPGLEPSHGAVPMSHDALATFGPSLVGTLREERLDIERRGEHPTCPLPRDLGQRIVHRARLAQRHNTGMLFDGVSLALQVLAGFITGLDTSPSQIASSSCDHSSSEFLAGLV